MPENLDWTNIALVAFIVFVTIILLVIFCRWLRRDNEERAYRHALERRNQGFYMVQDPANLGVWEVYSMMEEGGGREMQQLSPCTNHVPMSSPPPEGSQQIPGTHHDCSTHKGLRRGSIPIAKRRLGLEVIAE